MNRRKFLATTTGTMTAALAGCSDAVDGILGGGIGIQKLSWINLDVLRITFEEDHSLDGFGIAHSYGDNWEDAFVKQPAPEFSGPRDVRLVDRIRQQNTVYPNRHFKIIGYKGEFNTGFSFLREVVGEREFEIPAEIMPQKNLSGT